MSMNDFARAFGFKDYQELSEMVDRVDISTPEKLTIFENWKTDDGTKEGLLVILAGQS